VSNARSRASPRPGQASSLADDVSTSVPRRQDGCGGNRRRPRPWDAGGSSTSRRPEGPDDPDDGQVRAVVEDDAGACGGHVVRRPQPPDPRPAIRALPQRSKVGSSLATTECAAPPGRTDGFGWERRGSRPAGQERPGCALPPDPTNSQAWPTTTSCRSPDRGGVLWSGPAWAVSTSGTAELAVRPRGPEPGARRAWGRLRRVLLRGSAGVSDRVLRCRLYVMDRNTGEMTPTGPTRKAGGLAATGDGPLARHAATSGSHARRGTRPVPAATASSRTTASTRSAGGLGQGRHLPLRGRQGVSGSALRRRLETIDRRPRFTHYRSTRRSVEPECRQGLEPAEAPDGRLWVGTIGEGHRPLRPADGRFRPPRVAPGDEAAATDVIHTLFVDAAGGSGWAPTRSQPPARTARPSRPSHAGRLPSDVIYGVRSDHRSLWLSTNNGLACFDPRPPGDHLRGERRLQSAEFNFGPGIRAERELFFGA